MKEKKFKIDDEVYAIGEISTPYMTIARAAQKVKVLGIRYCSGCGRQYIQINNDAFMFPHIACNYTDCNGTVSTIGRRWIRSDYFTYYEDRDEDLCRYMDIMEEEKGETKQEKSKSKEKEEMSLQKQLDNAIAEEDYMLAAKLRDQIKQQNV